MNILITGASSRLTQAIAAELETDHELRLMDSVPVDVGGKSEFIQSSLLDTADLQRAVQGMDALIHMGEPPTNLPTDGLEREQMLLDLATRGTHNLFSAGVAAGIKKFIYAGTLEIFSAYPDDVYISELWKPLPSPEITQMTKYLGELTCREFARDYMVTVTCLRLGKLVLEEDVKGQAPDLMWLDLRDAAGAFRCALRLDNSAQVWWARRWAIYHVCADIPNPKFLIDNATRMGYKPTHNFQAQ
ncbi:NAD(P)-dependent oxidoreductase [Candidatus Poribacteria bacterium]|nr:NAD(P)-dependent oxidoreductase [Candidatus Poribacteria bacterium]